jgi:signal transduction histidine kinase/DNA-binding response OmpR family regulator
VCPLMLPPLSIRLGFALTCLSAALGKEALAAPLAPGCPIVESFSPRQIGVEGEYWCATQDQRGRIIVGSDRLAIFDGAVWRSVPVPGSLCIRSVAVDAAGKIWVGAISEVGYFAPADNGRLVYRSLVSRLPAGTGPLDDVWNVFIDRGRVVFVTHDRVLCWDGARFTVFKLPGDRRIFACQSQGRIFLQQRTGAGLLELVGDHLRPILPAKAFPDSAVLWIEAAGPGRYLLGTSDGFFILESGALRPFAPEAAAYLRLNRLTAIARLPDGTLAAGTLNGGILFVGRSGQVLGSLSQAEGLPGRSVFSLYVDRQGSLWCELANGIARIDLKGGSLFDPSNGLKGRPVMQLLGTKDSLLACTEDGLFRMERPDDPNAVFVPDPRSAEKYWAAAVVQGRVLAGRIHGIDELRSDRAVEIWPTLMDVFSFAVAPEYPERFWASDGYNVTEFSGWPAGPVRSRVLAVLPNGAASIAVGPDGSIWAGTETQPVVRLLPTASGPYQLAPLRARLGVPDGPGGSLVARVGPNIVVFAGGSAYALEPGAAVFQRVPAFPDARAKTCAVSEKDGAVYVAFVRETADGVGQDGIGVIRLPPGSTPSWEELDLPALASVGRVQSLALTASKGPSALWVGGTDALLRVPTADLVPSEPPPSPLLDPFPAPLRPHASRPPELPYPANLLRLHFFTTDFRHRNGLTYQTRLLGRNDEWSPPSGETTVEFSYLNEGSYRFEVRSVDSSGAVSPASGLSFQVLAPWYRTPWAYAGYFSLAAAAAVGTSQWRSRAVRRRNRELQNLVDVRTLALRKASAAKDEFVASISHEIRNPLNGVIGLAAALEASDLSGDQRHQLSMMQQCADHLASLIEEVLDFARIEAGEIALEKKPFPVRELLESVRAVTYDESVAAGMPIDLRIENSVPSMLVGDRHRIRQILINYVGNALKYAGRGRVTLSVRAVPKREDTHEVTFAVVDEGPGIPASEQAVLFNKFKRGSAARTRNAGGAGLGLALCRTLAEKMGGATYVQSAVGRGASFYLRLTLPAALAEPVGSAPAGNEFFLPASALVVEDQEFNAVGLIGMLARMGVAAEAAASGEDALRRCEEKAFVLILVDCDLPGMTGLEFAAAARRREHPGHRAVIVATTAYATDDKRRECLAAGMDGFVSKPITLEKLRAAISGPLRAGRPAPSVGFAGAEDAAPHYRLDAVRYIAQGDDADFERRMRSFIREMDGYVDEIASAMNDAQFEPVRRSAHRLVSHLSVVEHARLGLTAQQIEEAAVNRDVRQAEAKLVELRAEMTEFKRSLSSFLAADTPSE